MLIQFNFQNYKSFRDNTSLDLSATKITEHSNRVVNIGNDKLLRIAAIYGANASGKSNIYEAFKFMIFYVENSLHFGGTERFRKETPYNPGTKPFMFDETSKSEPSIFEVFFIDKTDENHKSYQYGFALKDGIVLEEWLYSKAKTMSEYKTIFYRNTETNELNLGKMRKSGKEMIKSALEKETLIVSLGAKLKIQKLKMVYEWFGDNEIINFSDDREGFKFRLNLLPEGFVDDKNVQDKVVKFFHSFDESIIGFDVKKVKSGKDKEAENYIVYAKHKMIDSNKTISIPLREESKGTLEMFSLFPFLNDVLKKGSVLFIDELNAKLHPLLVRNIILTFANPEINTNNAQLIFTTHTSWILSNNLLRRDEIWFAEKDSNGISTLYSLADFVDEDGTKIRKDENYEKNYLLGKYGAIPSLKTINFLEEE